MTRASIHNRRQAGSEHSLGHLNAQRIDMPFNLGRAEVVNIKGFATLVHDRGRDAYSIVVSPDRGEVVLDRSFFRRIARGIDESCRLCLKQRGTVFDKTLPREDSRAIGKYEIAGQNIKVDQAATLADGALYTSGTTVVLSTSNGEVRVPIYYQQNARRNPRRGESPRQATIAPSTPREIRNTEAPPGLTAEQLERMYPRTEIAEVVVPTDIVSALPQRIEPIFEINQGRQRLSEQGRVVVRQLAEQFSRAILGPGYLTPSEATAFIASEARQREAFPVGAELILNAVTDCLSGRISPSVDRAIHGLERRMPEASTAEEFLREVIAVRVEAKKRRNDPNVDLFAITDAIIAERFLVSREPEPPHIQPDVQAARPASVTFTEQLTQVFRPIVTSIRTFWQELGNVAARASGFLGGLINEIRTATEIRNSHLSSIASTEASAVIEPVSPAPHENPASEPATHTTIQAQSESEPVTPVSVRTRIEIEVRSLMDKWRLQEVNTPMPIELAGLMDLQKWLAIKYPHTLPRAASEMNSNDECIRGLQQLRIDELENEERARGVRRRMNSAAAPEHVRRAKLSAQILTLSQEVIDAATVNDGASPDQHAVLRDGLGVVSNLPTPKHQKGAVYLGHNGVENAAPSGGYS
ncbi:MAG: hypothetical protein WCP97_04875 [bacterium]